MLMRQDPSQGTLPGLLKQANQAMRQGAYGEALALYHRSDAACPDLSHVLAFNVALARKYAQRQSALTGAKNGDKRAVVFAAYSSKGKIEPYVLHYLRHLRVVADYVVVVGDFEIEPAERAKLTGLAEHTIFECHGEYDFGSYKRGHAYLAARGVLNKTAELIFCNDSCYGPLQGLAWMFEEMAGRSVDFWGLTQNSEFGDHVQSYFVVMTKIAFSSMAFRLFIRSVAREDSVDAVIEKYELGLTRTLAGQGFSWDTFISPRSPGIGRLLNVNTNPTVFPNFLAEAGAQLVKVKALADPARNAEGIHSTLALIATENLDLLRWICAHQQPPAWRRTDAPFFSVILPVFNRAKRVTVAIDSLLAQEFTNYELIVVDDGSTDGTCGVINERYADLIVLGRLRLISYAKNAGASAARNIGLAAAQGEWIAYLDSDNTVERRFLEVFAQEIQNTPGLECCYAMLRRSSAQEEVGSAFSYQELLIQNYIDLGVVAHRKVILEETGDFDISLKRLVDWDFLIRMTRGRQVSYIPKVVLNYHDETGASDRISVRESYDLALRRVREKNRLPFSVTTVVVPDGNAGNLGAAIDFAAIQSPSFTGAHTHTVLVFDNSGSDESWAVIERCARRYSDQVRAARQDHGVSDVQNLRDAIGATRSDFVRILMAGVLPPKEAQLQEQIDYLIKNPDCPQVAGESAVQVEHAEKLISLSVLPVSGAVYRRHVVEKLVRDGSPRWWPPVSFVVPLFNHLAETQAMLVSLQQSLPEGLDYEIVFTDDASSDGTATWLKTLNDSRVKVLVNQENQGYAANTNAGVQLSRFEFLGLLNNDMLFAPGWLEPMLAVLQDPALNAGVVGNVQYRVADGKLDHAGVQLNANAQFGHIETLGSGAPNHTKVLAITGACMLLRKVDFDEAGGFDELFVNGCEDIDLCFKLRAVGKGAYVAHTSSIRHHVSLSRNVNTLQNARNSRLMFGRWRKLIKQELLMRWAALLQTGQHAYPGLLSGHLAPAFVATPQAASRVIAEAMLLREEYRWARDLGEPDPNADVTRRCITRGLAYRHDLVGYAMAQDAEFTFTGLCSARSFFVCGRTTVDLAKQPIAITISVNGIQTKTVTLATGCSVNVGIIDPILLQVVPNHFRVKAHFVDQQGQLLSDASAALVITHVVVDDQMVGDLQKGDAKT